MNIRKNLIVAALWPPLVLACAYVLLRYWWAVFQNPGKALDMAYMLDESANVGMNGKVNTSISARAGRARSRGRWWGCALCRILDAVQANHCARAVRSESAEASKTLGLS